MTDFVLTKPATVLSYFPALGNMTTALPRPLYEPKAPDDDSGGTPGRQEVLPGTTTSGPATAEEAEASNEGQHTGSPGATTAAQSMHEAEADRPSNGGTAETATHGNQGDTSDQGGQDDGGDQVMGNGFEPSRASFDEISDWVRSQEKTLTVAVATDLVLQAYASMFWLVFASLKGGSDTCTTRSTTPSSPTASSTKYSERSSSL